MTTAIAPKSIEPSALPWLPLGMRWAFPDCAGIYFAMNRDGEVLYIGRSINICQRWRQHHRYSQLEKIGGVRVAWLEIKNQSDTLLIGLEAELIEYFDPPLNWSEIMPSAGELKRVSITIPDSVARRFRMFCLRQRRSVSAQITLLMEQAMQETEKNAAN